LHATYILLLVPMVVLPFIGQRWSLIVTYFTYGPLTAYFILSMWLHYTSPSHMSDDFTVVSGLAAGNCVAFIALARVIRLRKAGRSFSLPRSK
jgi:hypothetical protein